MPRHFHSDSFRNAGPNQFSDCGPPEIVEDVSGIPAASLAVDKELLKSLIRSRAG
jgi:hypothetical protein